MSVCTHAQTPEAILAPEVFAAKRHCARPVTPAIRQALQATGCKTVWFRASLN
jgi:hypothetical protein